MELKMIKLSDIVANPLQPRQDFEREALQELANSIKEAELLQPIVVRKYNGKYEIVAGERRFKAFQILKEPKIPAIVRAIKDDTDALEKSLIENLQRDDLTSVERENAIGNLWDSKRYSSYKELARKLGIDSAGVSHIINAKEFRNKSGIEPDITTAMIHATSGLNDKPRKKLLKTVSEGKIGRDYNKVLEVKRKLKEFPEPEQQMEILEEFEQQEDMSREIFDDIISKKKEIADGLREPEHIIEIESDEDKRILQRYNDIKQDVFSIYGEHIQHFKTEESKKEAICIIQEIISYLNKQLVFLGVNDVVDIDEEEKT